MTTTTEQHGMTTTTTEQQEAMLQTLLQHALERRIQHTHAASTAAFGGGAHVLGVMRRGVALLHLVAALGYTWAIERLLSVGADVDIRV